MSYRSSPFFLPPVIKNLFIINGIFLLATIIFDLRLHIDLTDMLGLHYFFSEEFRPHQFITYMFMHANEGHLISNMFSLWLFGTMLETFWGGKKFLLYYIVCGIGAALLHYLVYYIEVRPILHALNDFILAPSTGKFEHLIDYGFFQIDPKDLEQLAISFKLRLLTGDTAQLLQESVNYTIAYKENFLNAPLVVGASGSVFGILLAAGMIFPNDTLFLIPIPIKILVIIYGAVELFAVIKPSNDDVAHYAHLGGMLFGFILIKYWQKNTRKFY